MLPGIAVSADSMTKSDRCVGKNQISGSHRYPLSPGRDTAPAVRQFTIENHCISGGLYSALLEALSGVSHAGVTGLGWPDDQIIPHGEVGRLREKYHLTGKSIAARIRTELGKNS